MEQQGRPGAQVQDILLLIDRIEEIVTTGSRVPLSGRIMVEEDDILAMVDQLRMAIPQEIKQARRVLQDRQQIITDAQAEAEKIISVARDRAEYLMNEQGLVNESKSRSEEILRQAKDNAKRSMSEVDVYAMQMLTQLEHLMEENLEQIKQAKQIASR